jgi:bifunctional UDP-N-acetylglucosamine pyrophosphorylase/glucosamine-1-phosphate N-acetyltransferase
MSSPQRKRCIAIILAAGEGIRMRSAVPKVLHEVGNRSLLGHVVAAATKAADRIAVVIAPGREAVAAEIKRMAPAAGVFIQEEPRGTAHAVLAAGAVLDGGDDILVLFGDTPLISPATLKRLRVAVIGGAAVAVLGFQARNPAGYGRLIADGPRLIAIREEKDASAAERGITLCNAGVMALAGATAYAILSRITDRNAKQEFYLTDAVAIARDMGLEATALEIEEDEVRGINTRAQLAEAEAALQQKLRSKWLDSGVTMIAPETVFFSADTVLAPDVVIEPHVVFGKEVVVEEGATIHAFSHLAGAHVGRGASIGPFARLRPGTRIGAGAKIGNFVEVKAAEFAAGAKANHLSYIGDARVGEDANVGAGTITCNYDGMEKHQTNIGRGAFIGSNSALVAPVSIGDGAYVGSGSVITRDVPPDALAIARGRQVVKEKWAARFRKDRSGKKKRSQISDE